MGKTLGTGGDEWRLCARPTPGAANGPGYNGLVGDIYYTLDGADPRLPRNLINTAHATKYAGPVTLTQSTRVRARTFYGAWSAVHDAVFAVGPAAESFRYDDKWHDRTDGKGYSLTLTDATNPDLESWSRKSAWRASTRTGGSPGAPDTPNL